MGCTSSYDKSTYVHSPSAGSIPKQTHQTQDHFPSSGPPSNPTIHLNMEIKANFQNVTFCSDY